MPSNIPLFKANLQVDKGGAGMVAASGTRAVAQSYADSAEFLKQTSDYSAQIYGDLQVQKVNRGEVTVADLPSPVTVVGQRMRNAYAESQAIDTNIKITNSIRDITNDKALSPEGMQKALVQSANNLIEANIPEMAPTIRTNFANAGVAAVDAEANRRLAAQRALQNEEQKAQLTFWEGEFNRAYVASRQSGGLAQDLSARFEAGELSEDEYVEEYNKGDITAEPRLAIAQANLVKTVNSRIASGSMTEAMGQIYIKNIARDARNEYLTFTAADKGLSVLDKVELSFDEKLEIAQKASNFAGMKNAEEDRAERKSKEAVAERNTMQLQTAKNLALEGDTIGARKIVDDLAKKNEVIGSSSLMSQIDSATADINLISSSGGAPNPEYAGYLKRGLQTGQFKSMEDVYQDINFTGRSINSAEMQDVAKTYETVISSDLNSPIVTSTMKLIKLRLPDDPDAPSAMEKALTGAKITPKQKQTDEARARIEDGLISGIMDRTLITPQQQRDYVESEIRRAKAVIYQDDAVKLKSAGVKVNDTPDEIKSRVDALYGKTNTTLAKQKFIELLKAQAKVKEFADE